MASFAVALSAAGWLLWSGPAAPGIAAPERVETLARDPAVAAAEPSSSVPTRIAVGITITGEVSDAMTGAAVPRYAVRARRADDGLRTAHHQAEGTFALAGLDPGNWVVECRADGYEPTHSEVLELRSGEPARHLELRLCRGTPLRGQVHAGGQPIAEARVELRQGGIARVAETDRDGGFEFYAAQPAPGQLLVWARGYEPLIGEPFQVGSQPGVHRLELRPRAVVRGRVLGIQADCASRVHVAVCSETGRAAATSLAEPDGSYRMAGLPPGDYRVLAFRYDGQDVLRHLTSIARAETAGSRITLAQGEDRELDLPVAHVPTGRVRGRMTCNGVAGAGLLLRLAPLRGSAPDGHSAQVPYLCRANEEGNYCFGVVDAGTYELLVFADCAGMLEPAPLHRRVLQVRDRGDEILDLVLATGSQRTH